ncbi:MAG: hypothetical protein ACI9J0_004558 [Cryomorphaceae bacterium]|jgi:uncharacterized protein (DUF1330 family)
MTVYMVSQLTIHDRSQYDKYESGFAEVFKKYDGKMLSVDEQPMVLAGDWQATRSVIIEFPSKKSALTWLMSDEYQALSKYREAGSVANSILVKALE